MNSGCYENNISNILVSIKLLDFKECKEKEIRDQIDFFLEDQFTKRFDNYFSKT